MSAAAEVARQMIPGGAYTTSGSGSPSSSIGQGPQGAPQKTLRFRDKHVVYEKLEQFLKCGECQVKPADWDCKDCGESYCSECKIAVHSNNPSSRRAKHTNFVRLFICRKCGNKKAIVECGECEGRAYCEKCNKRVHGLRGRYRGHQSLESIQLKYNTDPKTLFIDRDEINGFNINVKAQLVARRFPSEAAFIRSVIEVLREQNDPRCRVNMARALTPGVQPSAGPTTIDVAEIMSELKRLEGHRPPSSTPPPEAERTAMTTGFLLADSTKQQRQEAAAEREDEIPAVKNQEDDELLKRPGSVAGTWSQQSRPMSANAPANAALFIDIQTQKLILASGPFEEACSGWRRVSRIFGSDKLCLFGPATNTSGSTAELRRLLHKERSGPKIRTASAFASAAQLAPPQYSTAGLEGITEFIPRFVSQESELDINEDGFNLGLLATLLNKKTFSNLFLSMEAKENCLYFFQFWTLLSKHDAVLERDALTRVQNLLMANAAATAPASLAGSMLNNSNNINNQQVVPILSSFDDIRNAEDPNEKKILTNNLRHDTRARVPEIPGGILSPSAQDEVFLMSPNRTRVHRAPDAFVPATRSQIESSVPRLNVGFLLAVYGSHRVPVATDDMVPFGPGGLPLFGLTENLREGESWKMLLEKAYAKMYGSFGALHNANPVHVLKHLTGGQIVGEEWGADVPHLYQDELAADYVWWKIRAARRFGGSVMLFRSQSVPVDPNDVPEDAFAESNRSQSGMSGDGSASDRDSRPAATPQTRSRPTSAHVALPRPQSPNNNNNIDKRRPSLTNDTLKENLESLPVPTVFPPAWGTEACAFERGNTAESDGGAVALYTRELLTKEAQVLGVQVRPQQAGLAARYGSWPLTKLFQFGGSVGADRFTFSANSPHWTKELRDYFDFRDSDNDLLYATPTDIATAYDTIVTNLNFVGAPQPAVSFRLIPTPQQPDGDWSANILVALRSTASKLRFEAEVYDFKRNAPVAAASGLNITLRRVSNTTRAALHPLQNFEPGFTPITVQAVQQLIPALGQKITLSDKFEITDVVSAEEQAERDRILYAQDRANSAVNATRQSNKSAANDSGAAVVVAVVDNEEEDEQSLVGGMFVLNITGQHRTDTLSGIIGFNAEDIAFATLI